MLGRYDNLQNRYTISMVDATVSRVDTQKVFSIVDTIVSIADLGENHLSCWSKMGGIQNAYQIISSTQLNIKCFIPGLLMPSGHALRRCLRQISTA